MSACDQHFYIQMFHYSCVLSSDIGRDRSKSACVLQMCATAAVLMVWRAGDSRMSWQACMWSWHARRTSNGALEDAMATAALWLSARESLLAFCDSANNPSALVMKLQDGGIPEAGTHVPHWLAERQITLCALLEIRLRCHLQLVVGGQEVCDRQGSVEQVCLECGPAGGVQH